MLHTRKQMDIGTKTLRRSTLQSNKKGHS